MRVPIWSSCAQWVYGLAGAWPIRDGRWAWMTISRRQGPSRSQGEGWGRDRVRSIEPPAKAGAGMEIGI